MDSISVFILGFSILSFALQKIRTTPTLLYIFNKLKFTYLLYYLNFEFLLEKSRSKESKSNALLMEKINSDSRFKNVFSEKNSNKAIVLGLRSNDLPDSYYEEVNSIGVLNPNEIGEVVNTKDFLYCFNKNDWEKFLLGLKNGFYVYKGFSFGKVLCIGSDEDELFKFMMTGGSISMVDKKDIEVISLIDFSESQMTSIFSTLTISAGFYGIKEISFIFSIINLMLEIWKGTFTLVYNKAADEMTSTFKVYLGNFCHFLGRGTKENVLKYLGYFSKRWYYCSKETTGIQILNGIALNEFTGKISKKLCLVNLDQISFDQIMTMFITPLFPFENDDVITHKDTSLLVNGSPLYSHNLIYIRANKESLLNFLNAGFDQICCEDMEDNNGDYCIHKSWVMKKTIDDLGMEHVMSFNNLFKIMLVVDTFEYKHLEQVKYTTCVSFSINKSLPLLNFPNTNSLNLSFDITLRDSTLGYNSLFDILNFFGVKWEMFSCFNKETAHNKVEFIKGSLNNRGQVVFLKKIFLAGADTDYFLIRSINRMFNVLSSRDNIDFRKVNRVRILNMVKSYFSTLYNTDKNPDAKIISEVFCFKLLRNCNGSRIPRISNKLSKRLTNDISYIIKDTDSRIKMRCWTNLGLSEKVKNIIEEYKSVEKEGVGCTLSEDKNLNFNLIEHFLPCSLGKGGGTKGKKIVNQCEEINKDHYSDIMDNEKRLDILNKISSSKQNIEYYGSVTENAKNRKYVEVLLSPPQTGNLKHEDLKESRVMFAKSTEQAEKCNLKNSKGKEIDYSMYDLLNSFKKYEDPITYIDDIINQEEPSKDFIPKVKYNKSSIKIFKKNIILFKKVKEVYNQMSEDFEKRKEEKKTHVNVKMSAKIDHCRGLNNSFAPLLKLGDKELCEITKNVKNMDKNKYNAICTFVDKECHRYIKNNKTSLKTRINKKYIKHVDTEQRDNKDRKRCDEFFDKGNGNDFKCNLSITKGRNISTNHRLINQKRLMEMDKNMIKRSFLKNEFSYDEDPVNPIRVNPLEKRIVKMIKYSNISKLILYKSISNMNLFDESYCSLLTSLFIKFGLGAEGRGKILDYLKNIDEYIQINCFFQTK